MTTAHTDRVIEDLRRVVEDAEDLLRETAGLAGERVSEVRERASDSLRSAREQLGTLEQEPRRPPATPMATCASTRGRRSGSQQALACYLAS